MFGDIRDKIGSLEPVFNESLFTQGNGMDKIEIDPARKYTDYTDRELKSFADRLWGVEARKVTGAEAKYILIGIKLEGNNQTYETKFLRGFDLTPFSHSVIGEVFLGTLRDAIGKYFDIGTDWPEEGKGLNARTVPDIVFEKDGMKLTVTGIGGGKYNLRNGKLNVYGKSLDFGPVPKSHHDQLRELLGSLVQKQPFQGYEVNME